MGLGHGVQNAESEEARVAANAEYQKQSALLKKRNEAYNEFCEQNDLKKRSERIAIAKWDRSQAAKARAAARRHEKELEKQETFDRMVSELREKKLIPTRSQVHIPPEPIFAKDLSFDDHHINEERNHNVTREMAELYINQSKVSLTIWNGQYERYYGPNGAVYVDWLNKSIRTAFSGLEFNKNTIQLLEVLKKYGY